MLRLRLSLGFLIVAAVLGLCWGDHLVYEAIKVRGIALFPLLVALVVLASHEVLQLVAAGGMRPVPWVVYSGNLLVVTFCWLAPLCLRFDAKIPEDSHYLALLSSAVATNGTLIALTAGVIMAFTAEMYRFKRPGGVTANIAAAVLAIVYVGLLFSFMVKLLPEGGLVGLLSLLIVVKMGDTGAYTVGRLIGRYKMAPGLSPGKTIEGAFGAVVFACVGSWATFQWLLPATTPGGARLGPWWGWILFGLLVGVTGMVGDLAESLIKRDVELKDSSNWVPGFGGVLDILDSALLAAPVAYACWAFGLIP
jgi:phosphatidate cytidylyltransferase